MFQLSLSRLPLVLPLLVLVLPPLVLLPLVQGQSCVYLSDGYKLNLAVISGITLNWVDVQGGFTYYWTPCTNDLTCGSTMVMASQVNSGNGNCNKLAGWDTTATATYDGSQWTLEFNNGATCNGSPRNTQFFLTCDSSININRITRVSNPSGSCEYDYYATGPAFCATSTGGGGSSGGGSSSGGSGSGGSSGGGGGLSGGWVFIIILLVVFVLYCGIGYTYNKTKVHPESSWGDVKTNTPHLDFWLNIPKWTWAGCCVTKEWIGSKIGDKGERHTPLAET